MGRQVHFKLHLSLRRLTRRMLCQRRARQVKAMDPWRYCVSSASSPSSTRRQTWRCQEQRCRSLLHAWEPRTRRLCFAQLHRL